MKRTIAVIVVGAMLTPGMANAWWAGRSYYGGGAYHHTAYVGGCYDCGGVSTGTAVASGLAGLGAGIAISTLVAKKKEKKEQEQQQQQQAATAGAVQPLPLGSRLPSLPPQGCTNANVSNNVYYHCGANFYKPFFGNNGVYYETVPNPF